MDSAEVLKEWEDWRWFINPNHSRVIQQLEQRKKDRNLTLKVKVVSAFENRLARYLAEDGAHHKNRLVIFRRLLKKGYGDLDVEYGFRECMQGF